ncbi:uncharacterized protein LOC142177333 [Nicotiana tabacum]|uniref:Uncharacterized protein LOC142177333 n=1 Tax=Nicotiana tabacum TaxID=4097 RepID=A0AC58TXF2_TOBAC
MKILKWTTDFKPNSETSLAPVWINLPDLPWHYYEWDALCRIVGPIGNPLVMDKATTTKSRPTTTKMRVQIDLVKPMLSTVRVDVRNQQGKMEAFDQKIKYEAMPAYCSHCKVQGHSIKRCKSSQPAQQKERSDYNE